MTTLAEIRENISDFRVAMQHADGQAYYNDKRVYNDRLEEYGKLETALNEAFGECPSNDKITFEQGFIAGRNWQRNEE